MKTLIVFLLSTGYLRIAKARNPPVEVFQIRETQDDNRLYIKNDLELSNDGRESKLARLLKEYELRVEKKAQIDKLAQDLIEKLQYMRRDRAHNDNERNDEARQEIYVLGGFPQIDSDTDEFTDGKDFFLDETRNQKYKSLQPQRVHYHVIPQNHAYYRPPRNMLRTDEDRTAAPRHHYKYEKDY